MRTLFELALCAMKWICRIGTVVAFVVLIAVVTMQVLGRLPNVYVPAWTEEVSRFALIHLVSFSCGLALLDGEMVNVDIVTSMLPEPTRSLAAKLVDVVILLFGLAIIPSAWVYLEMSLGERARSFDAPMLWSYVDAMIIPVCLVFFALARLLGYGRTPTLEELV